MRDDNDGEPWAATIVRIVEMGYEIHYDGYEDGIVETVPRDKILGPLFKVGEHVEIRDDGGGEAWGATITQVNDQGYEIIYDGYNDDQREWVSVDKKIRLVQN